MTNRGRGDYLERQTKAALEARGWVVVRAGGSLGCADLACMRNGRSMLVQCKVLGKGRTMPRIDPAERSLLFLTAQQAGARPVIATRYEPARITLLDLPDPSWTQYPAIAEIAVPQRPGKVAS